LRPPKIGDDGGENVYPQRALAFARALMAAFALLAVYLDPVEPSKYAPLTHGLLVGYAAFAVVFVSPAFFNTPPLVGLSLILHAVDVGFAGAITLFTGGPNSAFFAFLMFNVLSAAYTWGLLATLLTATIGIVMLFAQMVLLHSAIAVTFDIVEGSYDINRAVMRTTYLVIIGALVGVLGEYQHEFRREQRILARLLGYPRFPRSNRSNIVAMLERAVRAFEATSVACVLHDTATGQLL
jgi:hypothetical protein